ESEGGFELAETNLGVREIGNIQREVLEQRLPLSPIGDKPEVKILEDRCLKYRSNPTQSERARKRFRFQEGAAVSLKVPAELDDEVSVGRSKREPIRACRNHGGFRGLVGSLLLSNLPLVLDDGHLFIERIEPRGEGTRRQPGGGRERRRGGCSAVLDLLQS